MVLSSQPLSTSQFLTICICTPMLSSIRHPKQYLQKTCHAHFTNHGKPRSLGMPLKSYDTSDTLQGDYYLYPLLTATASRNLGET